MIITLKGANFSGANIGQLDSWYVDYELTNVTTINAPVSVKHDAALNATLQLNNETTFDSVVVTMNGSPVSNAYDYNESTGRITISIAKVTGRVKIVATATSSVTPEPDTPSGIEKPYIGKTLRFNGSGHLELYKEMGQDFTGYDGSDGPVEMGIILEGEPVYTVNYTGGCYYYKTQNDLEAGYTSATALGEIPEVSSNNNQHTYTWSCADLKAPTEYTLLGIGVNLNSKAGDEFTIIDYWIKFGEVEQSVDSIGGAFSRETIDIF